MTQDLKFEVYLFISDFLQKVLKSTKISKKDHSCHNTVLLKKPYLLFYEPQLTQHCKKYTPVTQQKTLLTCTAPFPDAQELHSRSTWEENFCIFLYLSVRNVLYSFHMVGG